MTDAVATSATGMITAWVPWAEAGNGLLRRWVPGPSSALSQGLIAEHAWIYPGRGPQGFSDHPGAIMRRCSS